MISHWVSTGTPDGHSVPVCTLNEFKPGWVTFAGIYFQGMSQKKLNKRPQELFHLI